MEELQNIRCGDHRTYALKYMGHGYGVAHTIMAACRGDRKRRIYFDFVPAFEFQAHEWPQGLTQHKHQQRTWFAIPRAIRGKNAPKDPLTFMAKEAEPKGHHAPHACAHAVPNTRIH
ncbi:Hypothetical predicted protein [Drosophila guanche]|uniref:Uncharacterized protein n=1 Tax=Drosophila guanche TaxID=7266 RepID=A0A3B0JU43_DROGU|nr:Hypothetical predicted protein [Drosophila guanche]